MRRVLALRRSGPPRRLSAPALVPACLGTLLLLAGCGGGGQSGGDAPVDTGAPDVRECEGRTFASTLEAIQGVVFDRHGCTDDACHGAAAQGGLDLRPDAAYATLFEVPSTGSGLLRVAIGEPNESYLWRKLSAKTPPGSFSVPGSPMPSGRPAISKAELEAIRLWIYAGAPEQETVPGTEELLDACLPAPKPITIEPLEPPEPGDGVQFVLPPLHVPAGGEREVCFAVLYDVSDRVPPEARDPSGRFFRIRG